MLGSTPLSGLGRHIRGWRLLGSASHGGIVIGGQQHRGVVAGNVHQHVGVVPAIDVSVAVPNAADQVTLEGQDDADKQKSNQDQTGRIHRQDVIFVGEVRGLQRESTVSKPPASLGIPVPGRQPQVLGRRHESGRRVRARRILAYPERRGREASFVIQAGTLEKENQRETRERDLNAYPRPPTAQKAERLTGGKESL